MPEYEAKGFYQNEESAGEYASQYHESLRLSNLRAKIFGWREEQVFLSMLREVNVAEKSVLDIASGTGRYVELLLNDGYQVGGVDISNEMLSFAKNRVGDHPNLMFLQQQDAEQLPFSDAQYDLITCIRLYHRIPTESRVEMLREVKRVGKGKAILFFGMITPWLKLRRLLRSKILPGRHSNPHPVTQQQLAAELDSLGFVIERAKWVLPFFADGYIVLVSWA